ncbi:fumarylacetoacetate hydrolase family protein [Streptomyces sp. NPDC096057]|uniref:2-keto-4-pentenoate hydratase n=1 Tax=Streptomyces sp. NPDC096057 TaxID=3155543 RepID=UPI00333397E7
MSTAVVTRAADALPAAERSGEPCPPVRSLLAEGDIDAAYGGQRVNVERGPAAGRRIAGRRTGLSSPAVRAQLGVGQPDFGTLFADTAVPDGGTVGAEGLLHPKAEAKVAVVLGADLPHRDCTVTDVIRATDFALTALEIVDGRINGWDITIVDAVADNASSGLHVLGSTPVSLSDLDLRAVRMTMTRAGAADPVSEGMGADCLGSPLNAAASLASNLAVAGDPLRAGDVILAGVLGPMAVAAPGDRVEARISRLGRVSVRFAQKGDTA